MTDWFSLAFDFLKRDDIEGLKLVAYPDPGTGGVPWTIGVGSTRGVKKGMKITMEEAMDRLRVDVASAQHDVERLVTRPLTQHQKAALVSFVFNIGGSQFATSTMLRLLNSNQFNEAADQFARWDRADGRKLQGLANRRAYEKQMFLTPD